MDQIRSLRATWWSIGIVLLVSIGLGILSSDLRGKDIVHNGGFVPNQTALTLRGFYPAQLDRRARAVCQACNDGQRLAGHAAELERPRP